MSFPNSPNIKITLLTIERIKGKIKVVNSRELIGISRSLNREEWKSQIETNIKFDYKISILSPLYNNEVLSKVGDKYFDITRSYINGDKVELYLTSNNLNSEDFL
jgi:hypothetical protein